MFFLRFFAVEVLVFVLAGAKYREFYLKSKGLIKIYFDGYLVEHLNRLSFDVYSSTIHENVSFVSIEIKNNPERAFIVSSTDGLIRTDKSWKCKAALTDKEEKIWPHQEIALKNSSWGTIIKVKTQQIMNFSSAAQFIWPRDGHCCNAYCLHQADSKWETKSFSARASHGKIRMTVIGQGDIRVFQDGAWVFLKPADFKHRREIFRETSTLHIFQGLIDRNADMLSVLVDVSEIYSSENYTNYAIPKAPRFSFTIFSDSSEIGTDNWKCTDTVGATSHGASEPWQWKNFYDAYWRKPFFYDLTIAKRLTLNGENYSRLLFYLDQSKLWTRKFSWMWSDQRPWTKVVYCRYLLPKLSGEDVSTSVHIEGGDEILMNSKFKRSDDGKSQFRTTIFASTDQSTGTMTPSHSNRELKDAKDLFDDAAEIIENGLSVAYLLSFPADTTIPNDLLSTEYDGSSNSHETVSSPENIETKLMPKIEDELVSNLFTVSEFGENIDGMDDDASDLERGIELFITARDDLTLFVDGYQLPFLEERPMEQAAHLMLDPLSQVLAVQAASFGGPAGILASGENNRFLNTDSRWLCTTENPGVGWETTSFDDGGWPRAREVARNDEETVLKLVKLIRRDAFWIWASGELRGQQDANGRLDGSIQKKDGESSESEDEQEDDDELEMVFCRFHLDWMNEDQSAYKADHSVENGNPVLTFKCPTEGNSK